MVVTLTLKQVRPYIVDRATIYKVLLVNTLQSRQCNYIPQLCKWEDIAFTHDLWQAGCHFLKVQTFAYHAVTTKGGGCQPVRDSSALIQAWATTPLPERNAQTVQQLYDWLAANDRKSAPHTITQPPSSAPTLPATRACCQPSVPPSVPVPPPSV